jgi:hypothetical protein
LQLYDKARNAVALAQSPVVRALVDPDGALQQIRDLDDVRNLFFLFGSISQNIATLLSHAINLGKKHYSLYKKKKNLQQYMQFNCT